MTPRLRFFSGTILFSLLAGILSAQATFGCRPATAQVDLDINNVRAKILNGGDLWWNLQTQPTYEVPKGSDKNSFFAGALWLGGLDPIGNLHVAAMTYRQNGNDFWPGPLDTLSGQTTDTVCSIYDRVWKVNRSEVESFIANRLDPNYVIPQAIQEWPGSGNSAYNHAHYLAPFVDVDGNGVYAPSAGDYPAFNFSGQNNCDHDLLGDQALWWVFNDRGNVHSESAGQSLGVEVHAMAFAYQSSNNHLNDATFYRYKIVNRSTTVYHDVWFGQWSTGGVGESWDDYMGVDVGRGLGYLYNADAIDGNSSVPGPGTYGEHPPAIGIDFLGGPLAEPGDLIDNDRDSVIDEPGERIMLARSIMCGGGTFYTDNPENTAQYYQFLRGFLKDNTHLTYGGYGHGGQYPCDFMFPGDSDPYGWGTYGIPMAPWWDFSPWDRTQLNSVGPFSMQPGEVEIMTIGVPWARDTNGNHLDAVERLKEADDYVQQLFDNCFSIPCVDQSPADFTFTVDDKLAYFNLIAGGTAWSWDFGDGQTSNDKHPSHYYTAPGDYAVCVNVTTPCGVLTDCDTVHIADKLSDCGPKIFRVEGSGNGNCALEFTKETVDSILASPEHRVLFPVYQPLHGPVKVTFEDYEAMEEGEYRIAFDTISFSSGWKLWKVGGTDTVYSDTTIGSGDLQRLSMWGLGVQMQQVNKPGSGLNADRNGYLSSSVVFADPAKSWLSGVKDADDSTKENWIRSGTVSGSGVCVADYNDRFVSSTAIDGKEDFENVCGGTWAPYRLCSYAPTITQNTICYTQGPAWNPSIVSAIMNKFENIANVDVVITADKSKWTRCCVIESGATYLMNEAQREPFHLRAGLSVDKNGLNVNNGGISDPNDPEAADYIGATGMGWFPGYAINLETGERLNMAFGENSTLSSERGRDMLWNPTENRLFPLEGWLWGGCHYVYVFGHNGDATFTAGPLAGELKDIPRYDAGRAMYTILNSDNTSNPELREVYADAMWATIPVVAAGHSLLECDVTVKLRVQKPYVAYQTDSVPQNRNFPLYGFRIDKEDLCCNTFTGEPVVYPNPFADECNIQFENTYEHNANLKLYDVQGKLVREYNTTSDRIVISGAGLFSGLYIWTLQVDNEEPKTGKVILR